MIGDDVVWFTALVVLMAGAIGWTSSGYGTTGARWDALCAARIGSSHVVDSAGDVWLIGGVTSGSRGLLVRGECANESGLCHGRVSALVPLAEVKEVRP